MNYERPLSCASAEFLMRCYWSPEATANSNVESDAAVEFTRLEAIELKEGFYQVTPLGRAWVHALLSTPVPTAVFIDAHGNVIPD